jgi:hypothetical protein
MINWLPNPMVIPPRKRERLDFKLKGFLLNVLNKKEVVNIDVKNIITKQLDTEYQKKFQVQLQEARAKYKKEMENLESQRKEIEEVKSKQTILIAEQVQEQLQQERQRLELQVKSKVEEEQSDRIAQFEKEFCKEHPEFVQGRIKL